jgi:flagellar basal-body rod protein FlgC
MSFFTSLKLSASGLQAERLRVDLATANLANANSTRTPEGGPYRRLDPVLRARPLEGAFSDQLRRSFRTVSIDRIVRDPRPPREVFNPTHPDADEDGILRLPNIQIVEEMVNLMNARRSYEANISILRVSREMAQRALQIGRSR